TFLQEPVCPLGPVRAWLASLLPGYLPSRLRPSRRACYVATRRATPAQAHAPRAWLPAIHRTNRSRGVVLTFAQNGPISRSAWSPPPARPAAPQPRHHEARSTDTSLAPRQWRRPVRCKRRQPPPDRSALAPPCSCAMRRPLAPSDE